MDTDTDDVELPLDLEPEPEPAALFFYQSIQQRHSRPSCIHSILHTSTYQQTLHCLCEGVL